MKNEGCTVSFNEVPAFPGVYAFPAAEAEYEYSAEGTLKFPSGITFEGLVGKPGEEENCKLEILPQTVKPATYGHFTGFTSASLRMESETLKYHWKEACSALNTGGENGFLELPDEFEEGTAGLLEWFN